MEATIIISTSLSVIVTSLTQDTRQVGVPEGALPGVVAFAHRQVAGAQVEELLLVATAHRPVRLGPRTVQIPIRIPEEGKVNKTETYPMDSRRGNVIFLNI